MPRISSWRFLIFWARCGDRGGPCLAVLCVRRCDAASLTCACAACAAGRCSSCSRRSQTTAALRVRGAPAAGLTKQRLRVLSTYRGAAHVPALSCAPWALTCQWARAYPKSSRLSVWVDACWLWQAASLARCRWRRPRARSSCPSCLFARPRASLSLCVPAPAPASMPHRASAPPCRTD